jgi:two-component system cell cycle response regulator
MRSVPIAKNRLILVVDDDDDNLKLVSKTLEYEGYRVERASSGEEALAKLKHISPDLVLLDINMPGLSGLDTLKRLRLRESYVSVIFVTARAETKDVILGLDSGADDYICKPFDPYEMLARVRAQLRIKDLNDRLSDANERLLQLVDIDDLTELFNMRSIYPKIENEIARARRYGRAVGVVMMDMDDFKRVNDQNDHLFGSFVLSRVGKLIRENIRQVDFAARYGGDEFLIVLLETSREGAERFGERLRSVIEAHKFQNEGCAMRLTASLGIAVLDPSSPAIDARSLVRLADDALYAAKADGKNRVCLSSPETMLVKKFKAG